jgi:hypothetical protein
MTMTNKGLPAKEILRQLGYKRYEPVCLMLHDNSVLIKKTRFLYQKAGYINC